MEQNSKNIVKWFVLKTVFSSEMKIKALLDERGIENFVPMCYKIKIVKGKKEKKLVPAIHDLVFVKTTQLIIENFKAEALISFNLPVYFLTRKSGLKRIIETVPERQMKEFLKIASHLDDSITFYKPGEIELKKGDKVRIIGGAFDGVEGVLTRVKGKRNKQLIVQIPGLAVATSFITPDLVEIIKDNTDK